MNLLKKIALWWNPPPQIITEKYEGKVLSKRRIKNPPRSYSIYMPQAILTKAYEEDPDRWDYFVANIDFKEVNVTKSIYDRLEQGAHVILVVTYPKSGDSLMAALEDCGKEQYDLKVLDEEGIKKQELKNKMGKLFDQ